MAAIRVSCLPFSRTLSTPTCLLTNAVQVVLLSTASLLLAKKILEQCLLCSLEA